MQVAIQAVLFDLGNTLVSYYRPSEFGPILEEAIDRVSARAKMLRLSVPDRGELLARAATLNREDPDHRVRPLDSRIRDLFSGQPLPGQQVRELGHTFLAPIFECARPDPEAIPVLAELRRRGLRTAVVSNTPWGSPRAAWVGELERHGLGAVVDAAVFCVDVGWRKPDARVFERALSLLRVAPEETLFVGDDPRWDVVGAQASNMRPVLLSDDPQPASDVLQISSLSRVMPLLDRLAGDGST